MRAMLVPGAPVGVDFPVQNRAQDANSGVGQVLDMPHHEGYRHPIDEVERRIAEACATSSTVEYLQQREVLIGGVRFLGCTLWTDFELFGEDRRHEAMMASLRALNDYRLIRLANQGNRTLHPADTAEWHDRHAFWLRERLATPFDGPTVVITHMAPSLGSVAPRYRDDVLSCAFASGLEDLVSEADLDPWSYARLVRLLGWTMPRRVQPTRLSRPSHAGR